MSATVDSLLRFTAQELGKRDSKTLLWSNGSPSSTCGAFPITVDLTGYDMVEVLFKYKNVETNADYETVQTFFSSKTYNAVNNKSTVSVTYGEYNSGSSTIAAAYRTWTITSTGIQFNTGYKTKPSSDTASTSFMIPYKVYGITGVV